MPSLCNLSGEEIVLEERILRRANNRDSRVSSLLDWERQEDAARIERFLDEEEEKKFFQLRSPFTESSRESTQRCTCRSWYTHVDTTYGHKVPTNACRFRTELEERVRKWAAAIDPIVLPTLVDHRLPRRCAEVSVQSEISLPGTASEKPLGFSNSIPPFDSESVNGNAPLNVLNTEHEAEAIAVQRQQKSDRHRLKKAAALKRKILIDRWKEKTRTSKRRRSRFDKQLKGYKIRGWRPRKDDIELDLEIKYLKKTLTYGIRLLSLFQKRRQTK